MQHYTGRTVSPRIVWQSVCNIMVIRLQHYRNPLATLWQSVSSRRGPIYRARIYENTHKMANGNVRAVK